ncbi:MAG: TonB-dependent receptor [Leeuwenhoekiella sp.]
MNFKNVMFLAAMVVCLSAVAQEHPKLLDEVVVTDSKFELKRENSGKTVTVIDSLTLASHAGQSVAQVINSVSGIEINGSRSNGGQNLGTYVRGGNNRQVLVLIDGVQLSDPSTIANDFDLRLLDLGQIEKIEIVKGAASTLYGNAAATAVINITTKKAAEDRLSVNLMSVTGTNGSQDEPTTTLGSFTNNLQVSGTLADFTYAINGGFHKEDGLSAVDDPNGDERDPFERYSANVKLGYAFSEKTTVTLYGDYVSFDAAFDNSFPLEDAAFENTSDQWRGGLSAVQTYNNGSFTLNAAYNAIDRDIKSSFPVNYTSSSVVVDGFNKYVFSEEFHTVLGLNYIDSKTEFTDDQERTTIIDPYANVVYISGFGLNINTGLRLNNHSDYGSNFVYSFNPSYNLPFGESESIKFLGSYATSFIAPSLSQLYGPFGANPDLQPEEDRSIEGGIEFQSTDDFRISAVYFNRKEQNFIDFGADGYINVTDDFKVEGFETEMQLQVLKELNLTANYTFVENLDRNSIRLPKHKVNAGLRYAFTPQTFTRLEYQYVSDRNDTDFSSGESLVLDAFSTVDFYISHNLLDNQLNLFAGVNNILNTEYQEIFGYTTLGRNVKFGFRVML